MTTVLTETMVVKQEEEQTIQLSTVDIPNIKKVVETETEIKNRREKSRNDDNSLYHVFLTWTLHTVHFLFITYVAVKTLYRYMYTRYNTIRYNQSILQRIQHDKTQLTKIPQHLSINVSRELLSTRSLKDWQETMYNISFMACWAWEFGIKEVSVYDASGELKRRVF